MYMYIIYWLGKVFGTVNGTLISKSEDNFWDIDIKNMTLSHLGHIGCNGCSLSLRARLRLIILMENALKMILLFSPQTGSCSK